MDRIASSMDELMGKMKLKKYSPQLNPESPAEEWLNKPGSPKAERPDEEPKTMPYEELVKMWKAQ